MDLQSSCQRCYFMSDIDVVAKSHSAQRQAGDELYLLLNPRLCFLPYSPEPNNIPSSNLLLVKAGAKGAPASIHGLYSFRTLTRHCSPPEKLSRWKNFPKKCFPRKENPKFARNRKSLRRNRVSFSKVWSGRPGSNRRRPAWESRARASKNWLVCFLRIDLLTDGGRVRGSLTPLSNCTAPLSVLSSLQCSKL